MTQSTSSPLEGSPHQGSGRSGGKLLKAVLGIVVVVAAGVWLARSKPWAPKDWHQLPEGPARDKGILADAKARPTDTFGALIRLAQRKDPEARAQALVRIKEADDTVREGAALSLGYFEDAQALQALSAALLDPKESVRIKAAEGFSLIKSVQRMEALKGVLKPGLTILEELMIRASILRTAAGLQAAQPSAGTGGVGDSAGAKASISEIQREQFSWMASQLREHRKGKGIETPVLTQLLIQAISLGAKDPEVLEELRPYAKNDGAAGMQALVIRNLAAYQDSWIRGELEGLAQSSQPDVRLAVVDSIKSACPVRRFEILEQLFKAHTDPGFRSAILKELGAMPSDGALASLKRLEALLPPASGAAAGTPAAPGTLIDQLNKVTQSVRDRNQPGSDPCWRLLPAKAEESSTKAALGRSGIGGRKRVR